MANAVLNIIDSSEFSRDIWQDDVYFTDEQWKESMKQFRDTVQHAKILLDRLQEEEKQMEFMDDEIYILGDVINFFDSIDVLTLRR